MDDIERQQINKIVPLGWYYLRLNEFVDRNDLIYLMSARGGMDSESYGDNSISNQEGDPDKRYGKRSILKIFTNHLWIYILSFQFLFQQVGAAFFYQRVQEGYRCVHKRRLR